jgi:cytochrome c biogenesis protein CcmG/thiol:disulfide interchange protein DsbE
VFLLLVPGVFVAIVVLLGLGLLRDPSLLPSTLIGRPVPQFSLPPVKGRTLGLVSADLKGEVSLVNVFASWCTACRAEHPLFMGLKASGAVRVFGLNYKDRPSDAAKWLDELGDPYHRTGADINGQVAIDWGVYGVPETFVVSTDGIIAYRHVGPITPEVLAKTILPLVRKLRAQ